MVITMLSTERYTIQKIKSTLVVENIETKKLLNQIQQELLKSGINAETLIPQIQQVREEAIAEEQPTIVKVCRLVCEHIESYDGFHIPIPEDEPVEIVDGEVQETEASAESDPPVTGVESLVYLLDIISNSDNKANMAELREYRDALMAYAEEN